MLLQFIRKFDPHPLTSVGRDESRFGSSVCGLKAREEASLLALRRRLGMANRTVGQLYYTKFTGERAATELVLCRAVETSWVFVVPLADGPSPLMADRATLPTSGGREITVATRRTSGRLHLFLRPKPVWEESLRRFGFADGETFMAKPLSTVAVPPAQASLGSEPEETVAQPSAPVAGPGLTAPLFAGALNEPARTTSGVAAPAVAPGMSAEQIEQLVAARVAQAMQTSATGTAGSGDLFPPTAGADGLDLDSLRRQLGNPGRPLPGVPTHAAAPTAAGGTPGEPNAAAMLAMMQQMQQMLLAARQPSTTTG